jgi:hypothetical protein
LAEIEQDHDGSSIFRGSIIDSEAGWPPMDMHGFKEIPKKDDKPAAKE